MFVSQINNFDERKNFIRKKRFDVLIGFDEKLLTHFKNKLIESV
jgi:hypothetical protein